MDWSIMMRACYCRDLHDDEICFSEVETMETMVESLSESSRLVSGRRCFFNVGGVASPSPVDLLASSAFPSAMSPSASDGYPHTFISHLSLSLPLSHARMAARS